MESTGRQIINEQPAYTLSYDPQVPCSHVVWHGFISSPDFRAACMRAYELTRDQRLTKGISDARQMRIISLADQQWFLEEYVPMALALGFGPMYSAVIVPADFFGKQSLDNLREGLEAHVQEQPETPVTTAYFDNEADAYAWLMNAGEQQPTVVAERQMQADSATESTSLAA